MENTTQDHLVSREEAAKILGVKKSTLEIWACTGRYNLPMVKIGRLANYKISDLQKFITRRTISRGPENHGEG